MRDGKRPAMDAGLESLVRRVEQWRSGRTGRSRIPEALWDSAVEAARRLGVSAVSRAARFSYAGLRSRLSAAESSRASSPQFVELSVADLGTSVAPVCELQVQRPDGLLLTIRQPRAADVSAVVSAFLGGQP